MFFTCRTKADRDRMVSQMRSIVTTAQKEGRGVYLRRYTAKPLEENFPQGVLLIRSNLIQTKKFVSLSYPEGRKSDRAATPQCGSFERRTINNYTNPGAMSGHCSFTKIATNAS